MATQATTKTFKTGAMRRNDEGQFIFEEYGKEESKFYNMTELMESILDQEGTSVTFKFGEEIPSDAEEI